jgi:hypothetical protein
MADISPGRDLWTHSWVERGRILALWREHPARLSLLFLVLYNKIASSRKWVVPTMKTINKMLVIK